MQQANPDLVVSYDTLGNSYIFYQPWASHRWQWYENLHL